MPSKNIIDIVIECEIRGMPKLIESLHGLGYIHQGNMGIEGREAFDNIAGPNGATLPHHHLYACESASKELIKQLAFRDYLMSHPERAEWLATKKIEADKNAKSKAEYIDNKSFYYEIVTGESMAWGCHARTQDTSSGRMAERIRQR